MNEYEHDDDCAEEILWGGCCKHYCPTGEHDERDD